MVARFALLPLLLAACVASAVGQHTGEEPSDWAPITTHAAWLLRHTADFEHMRGMAINERMWFSTHVIASPFGQDDPIPPSVIVLGSDGIYFHGTRLSIGTDLQMQSEFYSDANALEQAFAGQMVRQDGRDSFVRWEGCFDGRVKYVMLTDLVDDVGRYEVNMTVGETGLSC